MRLGQLLPFDSVYEKVYKAELPVKTAYKLARLSKAVGENLIFYRTKFTEIIEKYGEKDEAGNLIITNNGADLKINDAQAEVCGKELNELYNLEVELPDITFEIEEFDGLSLTVEDMSTLMLFIKE